MYLSPIVGLVYSKSQFLVAAYGHVLICALKSNENSM